MNDTMNKRRFFTVYLCGGIFMTGMMLAGCGSTPSTSRQNLETYSRSKNGALFVKIESDTYTIKQGDQVEISVWGYSEFNTTGIVREGGMITVPLVGDIHAEGNTKEEFLSELRTKLSQYIQGNADITVTISSLTKQRVAVWGAVIHQENYPVVGEVSLVEILASAGGATADSDLHHVKIIRAGNPGKPIVVDVENYMENGDTDAIPKVRAGDTVFVPTKDNVVRDFSGFFQDAVILFGFFRAFY
jgi:polysaccharide biosynthesis/export protein